MYSEDRREIRIDSFNPYESRFPNRKLITRDTLILVKLLRAEGYKVIIGNEDDVPVQYLYSKGLTSWFADPVNLMFFSIPITVLTSLITNQVQKLLDGKEKPPPINLNIQINGLPQCYDYLGNEQPHGNKKRIEKLRKKLRKEFDYCFEVKPPKSKYPVPIYLEHKPKIVGWCRLWEDDRGLASEGFITDKVVKRRITQNRLNGASVTGIAKVTECSVCKSNYVECNHIAGNEYDGKSCSNLIIETDFVETSIVKVPINEQCVLGWKH